MRAICGGAVRKRGMPVTATRSCRSPGGVLVEIATSDIGFAIDETKEHLGEKLLLPPWFEARRAEIVAPLEPIVVPAHATRH